MITGPSLSKKSYVPGEAVVALKNGMALAAGQEMLKQHGCTLQDRFELSGKNEASQLLHL